MKPKIKAIYPVYRVSSDTIRVGAQIGISGDIKDQDGCITYLLQLCGGQHSIDDVLQILRTKYPYITRVQIEKAIQELDNQCYLEDAARQPDPELSDYDLERYEGNINYFSHFCRLKDDKFGFQTALKKSRVCLLGLGGGGSYILLHLAALGVGRIVAVDYDKIELGNLNRQVLYAEKDLGRSKAEVAYSLIKAFNPTIEFQAYEKHITSPRDVLEVADGCDLIIGAIDEPHLQVQRWINQAALQLQIPVIFGASQITKGRVFSVFPGETGCIDCLALHFRQTDPNFESQFWGFWHSGFRPVTVATSPNISMITSMIATETLNYLTGIRPCLSAGKMYQIDFLQQNSSVLFEWPRYPDKCPTCGKGSYEDWDFFTKLDQETDSSLNSRTNGE